MTIVQDWPRLAASIEPRTQLFIDGRFGPALDGRSRTLIDPATGEETWAVSEGGLEDVELAVQAARRTFDEGVWSGVAPAERKRVLLDLGDRLEAKTAEMACLITKEMGKPIGYSVREVGSTLRALRFFAEAIDKVYGEVAPVAPPTLGLITREPIGVVGAIVPWNYPLQLGMWKIAPALATGNSVVVKPAEHSPLSTMMVAELAAEAGVPDGVLNVVAGEGSVVGKALGLHPQVDQIAFTGSAKVGRELLRNAADSNLKRVSLECGGKSPAIIFADAPNLERVAEIAADGVFMNAGQMCNAGSRILVQAGRRDEFLEHLARTTNAKWQPADPLAVDTLMGPVVDATQRDRVLSYVETGKREGASAVVGGESEPANGKGYYVSPTVFSGVSNEMRIAREEIFGPVAAVIEFDTDEEGVRLANDTDFGLAAGVWTTSLTRGHRVARALRAGTVYLNNWDYADYSMPFGGYKQSGTGRDKSLHGLDGYTQLKSTFVALEEEPHTVLQPAAIAQSEQRSEDR